MNKEKYQSILEKVRYCTVSTVDQDGKPWAAPVWYVSDENDTIYWWSPTTSQHSENIAKNSNVYLTIFDSSAPEGEGLGLYIRAEAHEVSEEDLEKAMELYNASTVQFKMSRQNCCAPAPTRMYKATPREMWMNDGLERDGFWQDVRTAV